MAPTEVVTETRTPDASVGSLTARGQLPPSAERSSANPKGSSSYEEIALVELGTSDVKGPRAASIPGQSDPADPVRFDKATKWNRNIQFFAVCMSQFLAGWNDGTTGPMLPRIQSFYHVGYAVVSLIFIFNCLGFVSAAAANVYLSDKLGFGKVMVLGSLLQLVAYVLIVPTLPFPVFILAFTINGAGLSLQDACANSYAARLQDRLRMGLMHCIYGLGLLAAPLVATQFTRLEHWSYMYLISLGLSVITTAVLVAVFRGKHQDKCLSEAGYPMVHAQANTATTSRDENRYRQIFRLKEVHTLAFFMFIYVGALVTLSGWTVTYIINERGGGPNAGYVSAGYSGGVSLGRLLLLPVTKKVGEYRAIYLYTFIAIGLELIVWLVPSLIGSAVAVAFVGMFTGPVYPIVMNHCGRILPHYIMSGCIGWIAGFGQAGSAFIPFLTGVIASREGIRALQPVVVSMLALMIILWFFVPSTARRLD